MADVNLLTNNQIQQLATQVANPQGYPNVNPTRYFSVDRLLKSALSFSYGVRNLSTGLPFSAGQTVDFLVLAVQGNLGAGQTNNQGITATNTPNLIFLANKAIPATVPPAPLTAAFTLQTPFNSPPILVHVKKVISPGVLEVRESLSTDFMAFLSGGNFVNQDSISAGENFLSVPRNLAMSWGFK